MNENSLAQKVELRDLARLATPPSKRADIDTTIAADVTRDPQSSLKTQANVSRTKLISLETAWTKEK